MNTCPLKHCGDGLGGVCRKGHDLVDERIEATIARMREQLDRPVTISDLAAAAQLSVSQLTRLFHLDTGMSPGVFLHRLRMTTARLLLEHTSLSVRDIMTQVGVTDRSHFARDFRRAHGLGPRALRKQLQMKPRAWSVGV
jgi:transcriptional regulator GlxA family with amidase domain